MAQWQVSRDGKQFGPYDDKKLRELAAAGKLRPTDYLWKEGLEDWIEAKRLKALFPQQAQPAAPAAPPRAAAQPRAATAPAPAPVAALPADADEEGYVSLSQRRSSRGAREPKRSSPLPKLIGGVVVIAAIVFLVMQISGGSGGSSQTMKYMPDRMSVYAFANLEVVQTSEAWKTLRDNAPDFEKNVTEMQDQLGFKLEDIRSITFGAAGETNPEIVLVVQLKRPIELQDDPRVTKTEVEGATIYEGRDAAFTLVGQGTIVAATPRLLNAVLKRDGKPDLAAKMKDVMGHVSGAPVAFAIDAKSMRESMKKSRDLRRMGRSIPGSMEMLDQVNAASLTAKLSGDVELKAVAKCEDDKTAKGIKDIAVGGVAAFKLNIGEMGMPPGLPELVTEILDSFSIDASGDQVNASITIPVVRIFKEFGDLMK